MTWLVTGGAGYIGGHVVAAMREVGEEVVVLDDMSSGHEGRIASVPLERGSVLDRSLVERVLREHAIRGVVHLAAKKRVDESVGLPLHYYHQNVEGLRVLLEAAVATDVTDFVFSSSAAVYGSPDVDLVHEDTTCAPVNPYGKSKLIGEWMVEDAARATGLRYANLRYFNVAGSAADELADRGAFNLVPMVFQRLVDGLPPVIFGDDYATPDGTCIRDFIHVADIASAHVAAARALGRAEISGLTANIGRGEGVSVREMIAVIREVTATAHESWSEPTVAPRRPGDPARVVASATTLHEALGWRAQWSIRDMVASAWAGWTAAR